MIAVSSHLNRGHRHPHIERIADANGAGLIWIWGWVGWGGLAKAYVLRADHVIQGFFSDHTFIDGDDIMAAWGVIAEVAVFADGELDVVAIIKWVGAGHARQHIGIAKFADAVKLLFDKLGFIGQLGLITEVL